MELAALIISPLLTSVIPAVLLYRTGAKNRKSEKQQQVTATAQSAADKWQEIAAALEKRIEKVEQANEELRKQVAAQEHREYRILQDFNAVFDWIERGAIPPPPARPDYLALPFRSKNE